MKKDANGGVGVDEGGGRGTISNGSKQHDTERIICTLASTTSTVSHLTMTLLPLAHSDEPPVPESQEQAQLSA